MWTIHYTITYKLRPPSLVLPQRYEAIPREPGGTSSSVGAWARGPGRQADRTTCLVFKKTNRSSYVFCTALGGLSRPWSPGFSRPVGKRRQGQQGGILHTVLGTINSLLDVTFFLCLISGAGQLFGQFGPLRVGLPVLALLHTSPGLLSAGSEIQAAVNYCSTPFWSQMRLHMDCRSMRFLCGILTVFESFT